LIHGKGFCARRAADNVVEQARQDAEVRAAAEDSRLAAVDQRCFGFLYGAKMALASRTPVSCCLIGWVAAHSGAKTAVSGSTTMRGNLMDQTLLSSCRPMKRSRSRREWSNPPPSSFTRGRTPRCLSSQLQEPTWWQNPPGVG
jgi:hypothetical protein